MALLLLVSLPANLCAQDRYKVKATKLNVRSQPSTNGSLVGSLSAGTIVEVMTINNGWATIKYNGSTCYISATHLEKIDRSSSASAASNRTRTQTNRLLSSASAKPRDHRMNTSYSSLSRKPLWRFDLSAMPHKGRGDYNSVLDFSLMLGGDIPISLAGKDLTLETGLRYLNRKGCVEIDHDVLANANYLEVPARLAYDLPIANNLDLRFAAGPYLSYMMDEEGGLAVGVEPTVSLKYKNFSVGLQMSAPLYKAYDWESSSVAMLNLSIRFGKKGWGNIGKGILAAGAVSQTILDSGLLDSQLTQQESEDDDDDDVETEQDKKKLYRKYNEKYKKWDQSVYRAMNEWVRLTKRNDDSAEMYKQDMKPRVRKWQENMRNIRKKCKQKTGKTIIQSSLESGTIFNK